MKIISINDDGKMIIELTEEEKSILIGLAINTILKEQIEKWKDPNEQFKQDKKQD